MINYSIVKVYPHDTSSYTEGLEWRNNSLYESGGSYGTSKLFQTTLEGKTLQSIPLPKEFFGEGMTILNNKIYQLTYQEHKVFVYDAATFKKIKEMEWPYEGWGIPKQQFHVRDVWEGKMLDTSLGPTARKIALTIAPHGCAFLEFAQ